MLLQRIVNQQVTRLLFFLFLHTGKSNTFLFPSIILLPAAMRVIMLACLNGNLLYVNML